MPRPLTEKRPRAQLSVSIGATTLDALIERANKLKLKNPKATIGQAIDAFVNKKKPVKPSTAPRVQTVTQHGRA